MRHGCLIIALLMSLLVSSAQVGYEGNAYQHVSLFAGPSETYETVGQLRAGMPFVLEARNQVGNWVQLVNPDDESIAGWAMTGRLPVEGLQLSQLDITDLPDADPAFIETQREEYHSLFTTPIIPEIHPDMVDVFLRGQAYGNRMNVLARVGDCNTAASRFLTPVSDGNFDLGAYDHLDGAIAFFGESFAESHISARVGFNVSSVFDPLWAQAEQCNPNEHPLGCTYRTSQPAVSVIMFGQNDVIVLNAEQYEANLRQIIEESLEAGIIPIVGTFTNSPDYTDYFHKVLTYNTINIQLANEYHVPLMNFWLAARHLPRRGIGEDFAHLTDAGGGVVFDGQEAQFGLTLYNLVVLQVLDEIQRTIIDEHA